MQENKKAMLHHFCFFKFTKETDKVRENFTKFTFVYMEFSVEDK